MSPTQQKATNIESQQLLPKCTENINGITVRWNSITKNQKDIITELLKNMVYVEGGNFMMGINDNVSWGDSNPVHSEEVNSFWISKYEITNEVWYVIRGNGSVINKSNFPIDNVSLEECINFIYKLYYITGLNFRIPTEIEWEYAARGGRKSLGFKYSGSNTIGEVAWYEGNSHNQIHSCGRKKT